MSYLHRTRLCFFGRLQADVSTVNNDVRHFDPRTFEPRFQERQRRVVDASGKPQTEYNGWWNPDGTGAFRLIDRRVSSVSWGDGTTVEDPGQDAAVGLPLAGAALR